MDITAMTKGAAYHPPTIDEIESALSYISPDLERGEWAKVGMAIKSELGDGGFDVFDGWSQGGDSYKAADVKSTWNSINGGGGIKIASIFHHAKEAGWKHDKPNALVDEAARLKRRAIIEAANQKADAEKVQKHEAAALTAVQRWEAATDPNPEHPYLVKKGIQPIGIKQEGDNLLIPMKDTDGRLMSLQTISLDCTKLFQKGSATSGAYMRLKGATSTIVVCEGYATGVSIQAATGHCVAIAFSCHNLMNVAKSVRKKLPDADLIIAADSKPESTQETARKVAAVVSARLAVPTVDSDFNDMACAGLDVKAVIDAAQVVPTATDEWDDPVPMEAYELPEWPENLFPAPFNDFVVSVAHSVEVPIEVVFMDTLAACAAAVQGKYTVLVKPGYFEPLNIWTMPVQPPATRKTKIKMETMAPIVEWEYESYNAIEADIKANQSERKSLYKRVEAKRGKAAKAKSDAEYRALSDEVRKLEETIPEEITAPRIWTEDVTPETLGCLMAQNHQRLAILSAEGGIFGIMAGRYSKGAPNIDIFLKGHAGEPVRVDRGSRDPVYMDKPSLTVGLSVQPEVLHGLAQTREFRGRGLLGRFLYAYPRNNLGNRTGNTQPVNLSVKTPYTLRIKTLLNKEPLPDGHPHTVELSEDALSLWTAFWLEVEHMLSDHGDLAHIRDWGGKLPGAVARIAGIFHCVRHATVQIETHKVSAVDMESAIKLGRVLIPHALKVFDSMQLDESHHNARVVLGWIRRNRLIEFRTGDCLRNHRSRFPRIEDLNPALKTLVDTGWIRQRIVEAHGRGKPPRIYDVNPAVDNEK